MVSILAKKIRLFDENYHRFLSSNQYQFVHQVLSASTIKPSLIKFFGDSLCLLNDIDY
jgi:hypothetical protein